MRGFTLIELLISMVIGLALIIAMGIVTTRFESSKRQAGSSADMSLNVGYLSYELDRQLRSAGSGFTTNPLHMYGCELLASRDGAQMLPATSAFPAPFAKVPLSVRMLPLIVHGGLGDGGSDVIQVMTGSAGMAEMPTDIRNGSVQVDQLRLTSSLGYRGDDLMILSESGQPCMLTQVLAGYVGGPIEQVNLGGTYYAASIGTRFINQYGTGAKATALLVGNATNNNPPRFMLLGVNAAHQLVSYDLLRNGGVTAPIPLADGVMDLRVRYGIDDAGPNDGVVSNWILPTTSPWTYTGLSDGTAAARQSAQQILAVQVSLVLRSERIENNEAGATPATLTMFSSLPTAMQATYNVPAEQRQQQHRVVELTIPLRNPISAAR